MLSVSACKNESDKIRGVWMGGYSGFLHDDGSVVGHQLFPVLIEFTDTKFISKQFANSDYAESEKSASFNFKDDILVSNGDSISFLSYHTDSLVYEESNSNKIFVLRRINLSTSPQPNFQEGVYHYQIDDYTDTLQFLGNNKVMHLNKRHVFDGKIHEWRISRYNNLNFFVIHGFSEIPFLITELDGNDVKFKTFFKKELESTLEFLPDYNFQH